MSGERRHLAFSSTPCEIHKFVGHLLWNSQTCGTPLEEFLDLWDTPCEIRWLVGHPLWSSLTCGTPLVEFPDLWENPYMEENLDWFHENQHFEKHCKKTFFQDFFLEISWKRETWWSVNEFVANLVSNIENRNVFNNVLLTFKQCLFLFK